MRDQLAYRIPNNEVVSEIGCWNKSSLKSIATNKFFVTDFTKEKVFEFTANELGWIKHFNYREQFNVSETKEEYLSKLDKFVSQFEVKHVKKAIFSRVEIVQTNNIDLEELFNRLCNKYPTAFVYLISSSEFGTWVGATPEILLDFREDKFHTMALAGTKKEEGTAWGNKEKEEQQIVTDYIKQKLEKIGVGELNFDGPKTYSTGTVFHLKTDVSFSSKPENWVELVDELHPTPAVCGIPTEKALELILNIEDHNRDFYCGVLGKVGAQEANLYVNLRCMQVHENSVSVYVGGGITEQSILEDEYNETVSKSGTMVSVLKSWV